MPLNAPICLSQARLGGQNQPYRALDLGPMTGDEPVRTVRRDARKSLDESERTGGPGARTPPGSGLGGVELLPRRRVCHQTTASGIAPCT